MGFWDWRIENFHTNPPIPQSPNPLIPFNPGQNFSTPLTFIFSVFT